MTTLLTDLHVCTFELRKNTRAHQWTADPVPLVKGLAQSWHMEKSCDHWASQDFPGLVAPQLLHRTHLVQIWKEKAYEQDDCGRNIKALLWKSVTGVKVEFFYRRCLWEVQQIQVAQSSNNKCANKRRWEKGGQKYVWTWCLCLVRQVRGQNWCVMTEWCWSVPRLCSS